MDISIYKGIFDAEHDWHRVEDVARKLKVLSAYEEIYREEDGMDEHTRLLLNIYAMFHRKYRSGMVIPWDKERNTPDVDKVKHDVVEDIKYYGIAKVFKHNFMFFNRYGLKPEVREFILDIISEMDILDMSEQDIVFARDYGLMDITRTKFKNMVRAARHDPEKLSKYKDWAYNWAYYFNMVADKYLVNVTERYGSVMIDRDTNRQVSAKLHCGGEHDPKIAIGTMFAKICDVEYPNRIYRIGDLPTGTSIINIPQLSSEPAIYRAHFQIIDQFDTATVVSRISWSGKLGKYEVGEFQINISPDTPVIVMNGGEQ